MGELLSQTTKLNIGKLNSSIDLHLLLIAFSEVSEVKIIEYLKKWQSNVKESILEENIVKSIILQTPPLETQIKICNGIMKSVKKCDNLKDKNKILELHQIFLESYLRCNGNHNLLDNIKLPNFFNDWKNASALCLQDDIIPNKYKLNLKYNSLLKEIKFISKPNPIENFSYESKIEYSKKDILDLFKNIANSDSIQRNLVGIFLSFLGDGNIHWKKWAEDYFLENGLTVETIRNEIKQSWEAHWNSKTNKTFEEHFSKLKVDFEMLEFPSKSIVQTITGNKITVDSEYVLIAPKYIEKYPVYKFAIYNLNIDNIKNINTILKQALDFLVLKIHNLKPKDSEIYRKLWNVYNKGTQLSIRIAQQLLIQEMITIFRRLKLGIKNKKIKEILFMKQSLEHKKAINIEQGYYNDDYGNKEKEIRESIVNIIKLPEIQKQLLNGVKNELKNFQYTKNSVIFELFQNADDAYLEKESLDLKINEYVFKIIIKKNTLYVIHYGRNINQHKGNRFNEEEQWGFSNDLLKMLTLNYSDKELNNVTGKFGLGFKSVFFITDMPKILSGMIGFKVLGAIYPAKLSQDEKRHLRKEMEDSYTGTIFQLDLNEGIKAQEIIEDFEKYAYIQTCFSKEIKKIKIIKNGKDNTFTNSMKSILDIDNISLVNVSDIDKGLSIKSEYGTIIFKLKSNGFVKFEEKTPTFWVTVPTREEPNLGFLVNADFDIDVGRTQLANNNENNIELAKKIGKDFYKNIAELYQKSIENFDNLKKQMGLNENLSLYDFWNSLFNILTFGKNEEKTEKIAYELFWESYQSGYYGFINENKALPNGFEDKYKNLISLTDLKYKISGILSDQLDMLNKFFSVSKNNEFENIKSGGISKSIFSKLPIKDKINIKELYLKDFIQKILKNKKNVDIDIANKLGDFLSIDLFEKLIGKEKGELQKYLQTLKFKSKSNQYTLSNEILIMKNYEEEDRLASFAPDEFILNEGYSENGIKFIVFCRVEIEFDNSINKITNWAINADTESKQVGVLSYLLNGKLHRELKEYLRYNYLRAPWLIQLKDDKYSSRLLKIFKEKYKKDEILASLGFAEENNNRNKIPHKNPFSKNEWDELLIYWEENKETIINEYEAEIYPHFFDKNKITDDYENEEVRKNWMILFMLGMTHTFGLDNSQS